MLRWLVCAALCLLSCAAVAAADDGLISLPATTATPAVGLAKVPGLTQIGGDVVESLSPGFNFFAGVGASYNSVKVDQHLYAEGTTNVYSGSTLVASGEAAGPSAPFHGTQTTFAPLVQFGYFGNANGGPWFRGLKFVYKYLGTSLTNSKVDSPQAGALTPLNGSPDNFTGNCLIGSSQVAVNHQLTLISFMGRSFGQSQVYLGGGPVVFGTQSNVYNCDGYADLNGTHTDVTGAPVSFGSSKWMWGGVAQLGLMYYLNSSCYFDLNYDFAITSRYSNNYTSAFTSQSGGFTDRGTLFISTTDRLTVQSIALSVNWAF